MLTSARAAFARGLRTVKLKLGVAQEFATEYTGRSQTRREFGVQLKIRLDANRSLSLDDAPGLLERLAELQPEFIEEPVRSRRSRDWVRPLFRSL